MFYKPIRIMCLVSSCIKDKSKPMIQMSIISFNLAINICMFLQADPTVCPNRVSTPRTKTQLGPDTHQHYTVTKKQHRTGTERKVWSKGQPQSMFSLPVDLYMYVYRESMHSHWNCLHVSFTVALPIKCLHTILLGPYKYMVGDIVGKLTPRQ